MFEITSTPPTTVTAVGVAEAGIRPEVQVYRLDEANKALHELRAGDVRGAKVLAIGGA